MSVRLSAFQVHVQGDAEDDGDEQRATASEAGNTMAASSNNASPVATNRKPKKRRGITIEEGE